MLNTERMTDLDKLVRANTTKFKNLSEYLQFNHLTVDELRDQQAEGRVEIDNCYYLAGTCEKGGKTSITSYHEITNILLDAMKASGFYDYIIELSNDEDDEQKIDKNNTYQVLDEWLNSWLTSYPPLAVFKNGKNSDYPNGYTLIINYD